MRGDHNSSNYRKGSVKFPKIKNKLHDFSGTIGRKTDFNKAVFALLFLVKKNIDRNHKLWETHSISSFEKEKGGGKRDW